MLRRAAFAASGAGALLAAVAGSGVATEHQTPARTFTVLSHAYDDARPPPGYDVRWLTDHFYEAETTTTEAPPPTTEPPTTEPPTTVPVTVVRTTSPATTPTTAPAAPRATTAPTTAPRTPTGRGGGNTSGVSTDCESGSNYAINTGNGYFGAYQWLPGTFNAAVSLTEYAEWSGTRPDLAPAYVQDAAAAAWVAAGHRGAWPNC